MKKILQIKNITKEYQMGEVIVKALQGISLDLYEGEFLVILGPSGSGKSTLLNIAGGIDVPSSGEVIFSGENIAKYTEKQLTEYRRNAIGFIFQFYNLIQNLTAQENIDLPAELSKNPISSTELLKQIDMLDRAAHFPSQLSGGEQQRVAIARALAKNPEVLLCDEPTGALDVKTGIQVLQVLKDFNSRYKKTVAVITHNVSIGDIADRVITLRDGEISDIKQNKSPIAPKEVYW